jgi:hypothetical protein
MASAGSDGSGTAAGAEAAGVLIGAGATVSAGASTGVLAGSTADAGAAAVAGAGAGGGPSGGTVGSGGVVEASLAGASVSEGRAAASACSTDTRDGSLVCAKALEVEMTSAVGTVKSNAVSTMTQRMPIARIRSRIRVSRDGDGFAVLVDIGLP